MTPLQSLITDRLAELRLSYREAAEKSGGLVSFGTLNQLALGTRGPQISEQRLRGIALALDVSIEKVREAAAASRSTSGTEFRLPAKASELDPRERKAVLAMVDAFLAGKKAGARRQGA